MPNPNSPDTPVDQLATMENTGDIPPVVNPQLAVDNPEVNPVDAKNTKDFEELMDYTMASVRLKRLIAEFTPIMARAVANRKNRFKDINLEVLRDQKKIANDAFLLPIRTIETNIRREQPAYINYLKQSRRLVIFRDVIEPLRVTTRIEDDFTRGMTYSGWELPHFKCIDGSQTHGWDSVEVLFDITKPLHVALEHVGNDRLIFPTDSQNIQNCELIIRCFTVTIKQLKNLESTFKFDSGEVSKLIDKQNENKKESVIKIYKKFCKYNDVVYVAWFATESDDWLKAPEKLFLGRRQLVQVKKMVDVPTPVGINPLTGQPIIQNVPTPQTSMEWQDLEETQYPIFILPYSETEQFQIISHKGRVFLDKHKQEAMTANLSQFLNGCQRASSIYPSIKDETGKTAKELQSITIGDGIIPPVPLTYTSPPYPEAVMLSLQQYLDVHNSNEIGQINFAAMNRKDSKKTATEVSAAQEEASRLNSVQLTLYSTFIREVYTFAWEIVKSRAAQGKIVFLVDPETGQNDIELLNRNYDIRSAGDIDVVKRSEIIQQYKEFWPIISQTPLANTFLSRLVRLIFPDEGELYSKILEQGDPRQLVAQLAMVLEKAIDPQEMAALSPLERQNLMMLMQQAKQFSMQESTAGQQPQGGGMEANKSYQSEAPQPNAANAS